MMKNFAICLLLMTVFASCEKLEEAKLPPSDDTSVLQGKWVLQSATCFCFFPDEFDFNAHTLAFDSTAKMVTIENSEETSFVTSAGTYDFIEETDRVTIDSTLVYLYEVRTDSLILNFADNPDIADDEVSLTYIKN